MLSLTSTAQKCRGACEFEETGGGVVPRDAGIDEAPGGRGRRQNRPPAARWRALTRVPDCCTRGAARRARVPRRVHDAVSHFSVYCDEASDATIAGGARVDGEETCGAAADGLAETKAAPAADAPTKPTLAEAVSRCLPPQKDLQLVLRPVPPLVKPITVKQAHAVTEPVRREQREMARETKKPRSTRHVPVPTRRRRLRRLLLRATTPSTRRCPCDFVSTRLTGLCPNWRRTKRPRRPRRV